MSVPPSQNPSHVPLVWCWQEAAEEAPYFVRVCRGRFDEYALVENQDWSVDEIFMWATTSFFTVFGIVLMLLLTPCWKKTRCVAALRHLVRRMDVSAVVLYKTGQRLQKMLVMNSGTNAALASHERRSRDSDWGSEEEDDDSDPSGSVNKDDPYRDAYDDISDARSGQSAFVFPQASPGAAGRLVVDTDEQRSRANSDASTSTSTTTNNAALPRGAKHRLSRHAATKGDEVYGRTVLGGTITLMVLVVTMFGCCVILIQSQDVSRTLLTPFLDPSTAVTNERRADTEHPTAHFAFIWHFKDPYSPGSPDQCQRACAEFLSMAAQAPYNTTLYIDATCELRPPAYEWVVDSRFDACRATWSSTPLTVPDLTSDPLRSTVANVGYPMPNSNFNKIYHDTLYIGSYLHVTHGIVSTVNDDMACQRQIESIMNGRLGAKVFAGYYWNGQGTDTVIAFSARRTHFRISSLLSSMDTVHPGECFVDGAVTNEFVPQASGHAMPRGARHFIANVTVQHEPVSWVVTPSTKSLSSTLFGLFSIIGAAWGVNNVMRATVMYVVNKWPRGPWARLLNFFLALCLATGVQLIQWLYLSPRMQFDSENLSLWIFGVIVSLPLLWGSMMHSLLRPWHRCRRHYRRNPRARCRRLCMCMCCIGRSASARGGQKTKSAAHDDDLSQGLMDGHDSSLVYGSRANSNYLSTASLGMRGLEDDVDDEDGADSSLPTNNHGVFSGRAFQYQ